MIAVLGVLAAVVVPNVGRFTKSGYLAAAKQELETVQTAVDATMAARGWNTVTGVWIGVIPVTGYQWTLTGGADTAEVDEFLRRTVYSGFRVDTDGLIVKGYYKNDTIGNRIWHYTNGNWVKVPIPGGCSL